MSRSHSSPENQQDSALNPYDELKSRLSQEPKTWLVTGVAGFIGSHLLENLLSLGQIVVGLDNFSTGSQSNLDNVRTSVGAGKWQNFRMIEGDIRRVDTCLSACLSIDYVLHQAALGSVPRSIQHPLNSHENNVNGFLNVLTAARENAVKRVVYASSSSVYGDHAGLPKIEDQLGTCLSPYAVTKRINELYAAVFAKCYGLETIGLRYFNVFGPRQDPNGPYAAVIPRWISAMIKNQPVFINGDGATSRDFCFVANAVQANILAALSPNAEAVNQVYNVAAHARTTLNGLFETLRNLLLPFCPHLQNYLPSYTDFRPGDVRHSEANICKAQRLLGYRATYPVQRGLSETIRWYCGKSPLPRPAPLQRAGRALDKENEDTFEKFRRDGYM